LVSCHAIPPKLVDQEWEWVEPYITRALDYSLLCEDVDEVRKDAISGDTILMVFTDGDDVLSVVAAEIIANKRRRIIHVLSASGKRLGDWLDAWWDAITNIAKELDIQSITINGRRGWEKHLKPYGFKHKRTVLEVSHGW
jgi:hypothetical protein